MLYIGSKGFNNTKNIVLDHIKLLAGSKISQMFYYFRGKVNSVEIVHTDTTWVTCTQIFDSIQYPPTLKITNEMGGRITLYTFFGSTSKPIPEAEIIGGSVIFNKYFNNSAPTVGKITLTNCEMVSSSSVTAICGVSNIITTYFGGIENANSSFNLKYLKKITNESVTDIINGLATVPTTQTLTLYTDVYNTLTEEQKELAISKN